MFSTLPANPFPPSTEQMNKGDNTELNNRVQALETSMTGILNGTSIDSFGDVETALATKANNEIIAPLFDETSGVYAVGDLVVNDGVLYKFTSPHETAGAWDSSEVSAVKVSEELATLKSGLTNVDVALSVPEGTGKNVFDKDNIDSINKYYDGANWKNQASGKWKTIFIPVIAGRTYTSSGFTNTAGAYSVFVKADKSTVLLTFTSANNNSTFVVPDLAEYVGFAIWTPDEDYTSAQLELGSTATAYAPYIPSVESRIEAVESGLINCVKTEKHSVNPNVSFSIALETTKLYNIEFTSINSQNIYNFYKYAMEYVSGGWKLCEIDKVEKDATHAALSFVITDNNLVVTDTGDWGVTVMCQIASILL